MGTVQMITRFKKFQIRWNEKFGKEECPYLFRWMVIFFGFSIRLHHWIRSDDKRYFHDHACNFLSIVLFGRYLNVTKSEKRLVKAGEVWYSNGDTRHYLQIPNGGAWTLLLCGKPYKKWGFYVDGVRLSPKKFYKRFGETECDCQ